MPAQHRRHVLLALFLTLSASLGCALLVERNGWAAPSSLSSPAGAAHMVDAFEAVSGPQPGFRRNHAKGLCVSGRFDSNGQGVALANTGLLRTGSYPVTGRFSVVGGNPSVNDTQGGMRSLALDISNGGETWRMALNSSPVFFVRTPEALLEQLQASVPTDGREARIRHFRRDHPESQAFEDWMAAHRPSTGFDNAAYFSVNTFRFNAVDGQEHLVRWHLQPETPYAPLSDEQIAQNDPDMLSYGLASRLAEGPLRWHLILTPALPGDPVNDATQLWTQPGHQEIDAGVLVIDAQQPQMDGPCRDIDFNPLILPPGITPSDDPLLQARGAAYAESHRRRVREMAGQ